MAPESQMKNTLSGMTTRQKTIAAVFVVIVLILIWQVAGLFSGGKSAPKTISPAPVKTMGATSPTSGAMPVAEELPVRQAALPVDNQFVKLQRDSEQQYVTKLNELESLKIQREIAEMNQAIAASKLATVTAEKGISDLLTKPTPVQVSAGEYANKLANPVRPGETVVGQQTTTALPTEIQYTVISVSMQLHKWSAVVGYQGKLYNVSIGDVLPVDGAVVESINRNGVVLNKDGKKRKVSLVAAI